jgi:hypothetical protein
MTKRENGYSLTTNGEADWLIAEWEQQQGELPPEPKPMKKTAKREDYQLELF